MKRHAGDTTQNKRNRVYAYPGHGLATCGTVGVPPLRWAPVSAVGALMPFMLATCPTSALAGSAPGPRLATGHTHAYTRINAGAAQTHSLRGPGSFRDDVAQSLTA